MFYPGQKVECVDDTPNEWGDPPLVVKGQVYTVRDCRRAIYRDGYGVTLYELNHYPPYSGFKAERFRPIVERKTSIEVFEKMLKPEKEKV